MKKVLDLTVELATLIGKNCNKIPVPCENTSLMVSLAKNPDVADWMENNPDSYTVSDDGSIVLIVSLIKTTKAEWFALGGSLLFPAMSLSKDTIEERKLGTQNPDIFLFQDVYYFNASPKSVYYTKAEKAWLALWKDFDHDWQYSDSLEVASDARRKSEAIYNSGLEQGFTRNRLQDLYESKYSKH